MNSFHLSGLALIFSATLAQAATVTVTQTETGMMRLSNCPAFSCLDTGVGEPTEQDSWQEYTLSAQFTFDEQDAAFHYASEPFHDYGYDLGRREFSFSGDALISLVLNGRALQFLAPVSAYVAEIWPAYTHRIYMTGGISWTAQSPFGHFRFSHYGERSIPYVTTPAPHAGVPTMNLPFRPVQPGTYIAGDSYFLTFNPNSFDLRVEVDTPAPVPLPAGGALLAGALAVLAIARRQRRA